jgi:hypothetical protein
MVFGIMELGFFGFVDTGKKRVYDLIAAMQSGASKH